jgi:hypothetical protein
LPDKIDIVEDREMLRRATEGACLTFFAVGDYDAIGKLCLAA